MHVRVRLFASLRDVVGREELPLELAEGDTAGEAWARLVAAHPPLGARRRSLSAAVNRRYVPFDEVLHDGDELVFVPPVSGG